MHVHSPICHGQLIEKNRSIDFIVWVLGRVEKNVKKGKYFFLFKTNSNVTHVFTSIFNVLFKNIFFCSVALVIKNFIFLYTPDFLPPCTYLVHAKKQREISSNKVRRLLWPLGEEKCGKGGGNGIRRAGNAL